MDPIEKLQAFFQVLSDINRLRMIRFIDKEERTVSEIVNATHLSQPLVSHHLKILKDGRVLGTKRVGPFIYYRLNNPGLLDALGLFEEIISGEDPVSNESPMFYCPDWWKRFDHP